MTASPGASRPKPGVIFVNPGSGPTETPLEDLRRRFAGHVVEECPPDRLVERVRDALAAGAAFIGAAGGDGTIRMIAEQLVGTDVPLLPVPVGTRNHFAKNAGVTDVDAAARAVSGRVITVDVGWVNQRCFVNNSSIGVYPKIVIRRELHRRRLRKGVANVVAAYEQLRDGGQVDIEVDGVTRKAWMFFVGNGTYGEGLLDLADRESLDDGMLDVRMVRADRPLSRLRIVGALLLGRMARSPLVLRGQTSATVVHLNRNQVEVALDGEVEVLVTPLRYRCQPGALRVLVPC
ncbi:MAG: NAD(+)/NADH kinase [Actinomycetota bacterium]|nr:NAD(+)/NADH kinase [Actinomycetota bacterium]